METPQVRETIETYGTSRVARAMGIPVTTLHQWKRLDAIPGKGMLHEFRVRAFRAAVRKLKPKPRRTRSAK